MQRQPLANKPEIFGIRSELIFETLQSPSAEGGFPTVPSHDSGFPAAKWWCGEVESNHHQHACSMLKEKKKIPPMF
jgi:hypothetical protein